MLNKLNKDRHRFVKSAALTLGGTALLRQLSPALANPEGLSHAGQELKPSFGNNVVSGENINMMISRQHKRIASAAGLPITINGSSPGP